MPTTLVNNDPNNAKISGAQVSVDEALNLLVDVFFLRLPDAYDLADRIFEIVAYHLRRDPRFSAFTLTQIDLLLAGSRRDVEEYFREWLRGLEGQITRGFKAKLSVENADD
jgi:hypothetical protein